MSVLKRSKDGDEVALHYGEYYNLEQMRAMRANDMLDILCTDGLNYIVQVKAIEHGSTSGNEREHIHLHFLHWSSRSDYRGTYHDLYVVKAHTYSAGIGKRNLYTHIAEIEDVENVDDCSPSKKQKKIKKEPTFTLEVSSGGSTGDNANTGAKTSFASPTSKSKHDMVLKRCRESDEVALHYGEYYNLEQMRAMRANDMLDILCTDGLNYIVQVKAIEHGSTSGNEREHIHLHFLHWSSRSDYRGTYHDLYVVKAHTYSAGIGKRNLYTHIAEIEDISGGEKGSVRDNQNLKSRVPAQNGYVGVKGGKKNSGKGKSMLSVSSDFKQDPNPVSNISPGPDPKIMNKPEQLMAKQLMASHGAHLSHTVHNALQNIGSLGFGLGMVPRNINDTGCSDGNKSQFPWSHRLVSATVAENVNPYTKEKPESVEAKYNSSVVPEKGTEPSELQDVEMDGCAIQQPFNYEGIMNANHLVSISPPNHNSNLSNNNINSNHNNNCSGVVDLNQQQYSILYHLKSIRCQIDELINGIEVNIINNSIHSNTL